MDKVWLIRTTSNQLLGPVSIKKIRELLEKGSLKAEDEISCGNGYWFFVREKELVEKYINNEIPQGFNPVAEADSVLTALPQEIGSIENPIIPTEDDLAFPEDDEKELILEELKLSADTLSDDPIVEQEASVQHEKEQVKPLNRKTMKPLTEKEPVAQVKSSFFNQNLLLFLAVILFILALAGFYFRKRLVKEFIETNIHIITPGYAQVIPEQVKKKLNYLDRFSFGPFQIQGYNTISGFNLVSSKDFQIENCDLLKSKSFIAGLILVDNLSSSEKEFINKCSIIISKKQVKIDDVLYPVDEESLKRIKVISSKVFKRKETDIELLATFRNIKDSDNKIEIKKIVDHFERSPRLFSKMALLSIFNALNLQGKVNSIITSILSTEYSDHFYAEEYSLQLNRKLSLLTFEILEELKENYNNTLQFDSLTAYLSIHLEEYLRDLITEEFTIPNRLSYVKEKTQSFNNAKRFPFAWTFWIEKYSSEKELLKFMDEALAYERLTSEQNLLTTFYSAFPKEEAKRQKLSDALKVLRQSKELVRRERAVRSLENEAFYNYLISKGEVDLKALFVERKNIYNQSLKDEKAILYSIFNLLKLGKFEDEYLIYLYASRL